MNFKTINYEIIGVTSNVKCIRFCFVFIPGNKCVQERTEALKAGGGVTMDAGKRKKLEGFGDFFEAF